MNIIFSKNYVDKEVCDLVRLVSKRFGIDLLSYKASCLERRISARKRSLHIESVGEYFEYIDRNPEEIKRLIDAVTIHTTRFFRDGSSFEYLKDNIIPSVVSDARIHSLRVWSAGCSTGEETYTLAIILHEFLITRRRDIKVTVLGTDISSGACSAAEEGLYGEKSLAETPKWIVSRYFTREGELYRIRSKVRRLVDFRVHDLINDPPLSGMDIVVCRNVMIHFVESVREVVVGKFLESLKDGGYLVLGKSEAITSRFLDRFELISGREKIYRKRKVISTQGGKR